MVNTCAKSGNKDGIVYSILTKENQKITAFVGQHKETFTTWEQAEGWVDRLISNITRPLK